MAFGSGLAFTCGDAREASLPEGLSEAGGGGGVGNVASKTYLPREACSAQVRATSMFMPWLQLHAVLTAHQRQPRVGHRIIKQQRCVFTNVPTGTVLLGHSSSSDTVSIMPTLSRAKALRMGKDNPTHHRLVEPTIKNETNTVREAPPANNRELKMFD